MRSYRQYLGELSDEDYVTAVEKEILEPMLHIGRKMRGFGYVYTDDLKTEKQLSHWISFALKYNIAENKTIAKRKKS